MGSAVITQVFSNLCFEAVWIIYTSYMCLLSWEKLSSPRNDAFVCCYHLIGSAGHHWLLIILRSRWSPHTRCTDHWPARAPHHTVQAEVTRQTLSVCQYLHNQVHYNIAREQMSHLSRVSPLISSSSCHSQKWVWPTQVFVRPSVGGWWPGWPGGSSVLTPNSEL